MNGITTAKDYLNLAALKIEEELDRLLIVKDPPIVYEAMRYSTLGGGKRIRAALCFLGAYGKEELALPAACATEMIHAYSLIHDDLPCMDDDDFRRGKPSCHKAFGEAIALLAGDALVSKAFEVLAEQKNGTLLALKELASASGADNMVGGQVLDLEAENKDISLEDLQTIHSKKTGALITVSLKLGALAAGREGLMTQISSYGHKIGLAFQITDDILDVVGTKDSLGKTPGKDASSGKNTYVTLLGIEEAKSLAAKNILEAKETVKGLPGEQILREFADYILVRTK
jgi:geranylgeranyl diphosphate synthase type II